MRSLRILLAEDDDLIGELLGEMLVDMGHIVCSIEVTERGSVDAALRLLPDLMIVDVGLNPGSGIDAVDAITQVRPVPHVLVSGNYAELTRLKPGSIRLEKPYRPAALERAMQSAMHHG